MSFVTTALPTYLEPVYPTHNSILTSLDLFGLSHSVATMGGLGRVKAKQAMTKT